MTTTQTQTERTPQMFRGVDKAECGLKKNNGKALCVCVCVCTRNQFINHHTRTQSIAFISKPQIDERRATFVVGLVAFILMFTDTSNSTFTVIHIYICTKADRPTRTRRRDWLYHARGKPVARKIKQQQHHLACCGTVSRAVLGVRNCKKKGKGKYSQWWWRLDVCELNNNDFSGVCVFPCGRK